MVFALGGFQNQSNDIEVAIGKTIANFLSTELLWLSD